MKTSQLLNKKLLKFIFIKSEIGSGVLLIELALKLSNLKKTVHFPIYVPMHVTPLPEYPLRHVQ